MDWAQELVPSYIGTLWKNAQRRRWAWNKVSETAYERAQRFSLSSGGRSRFTRKLDLLCVTLIKLR